MKGETKMYTTPFGRLYEPYMDVPDDEPENVYCKCCEKLINENDEYFQVGDEAYCLECEDEAYDAIAERHAHEYKCRCEY
jgi:hypothetical protein